MGDQIFGGTGNVGALFVYDTITGRSTDLGQALPDQPSVTSLVLGADGRVYGTTAGYYNPGHLFRFDPADPVPVTDLGVPVDLSSVGGLAWGPDGKLYGVSLDEPILFRYNEMGGFTNWSLAGLGLSALFCLAGDAPDGNLYGGGYGGYAGARLFRFNLFTGEAKDLGIPVPGDTYIETVVVGPDGMVYGGTSYDHGYLFSFKPGDSPGTFAVYGPPVWRDAEILRLIVGSDGQIYGGSGWNRGKLFRFDPLQHAFHSSGTATSIPISPRMQFKAGAPDTPEIWALYAATDGRVYVSGTGLSGWAELSRWDTATGTMELLGQAPGGVWTIYALVEGDDGLIYVGAGGYSGNANLLTYNPATGELIALWPPLYGEDYVSDLVRCPNGLLYGATDGSSTEDHGRLFSYNTTTHTFTDLGLALPGEHGVRSLACSPGGRLYGGTTPNGHLVTLDPEHRANGEAGVMSDLGRPVPGETAILALTWGPDGRLYGGTEGLGTLFAYQPNSGQVTVLDRPAGQDRAVYDLDTGADGLIYGVTGGADGHLFGYQPGDPAATDLGKVSLLDANAYSLALSPDARQIYLGSGDSYGDFVVYDQDYRFAWLELDLSRSAPAGTELAVDVRDLAGNVLLPGAEPGASLVDLPPVPGIRLVATLTTTDPDQTPALADWSVTWTQDPKLGLAPASLSFMAPLGGAAPPAQRLWVTNQSGGDLPWSASGLPSWLALDPSGSPVGAPSAVTATASIDGLAVGIYTATVQFDGPPECINCPVGLPVSLQVVDTPLLDVSPPGLVLTATVGDTAVQTAVVTLDNVGTRVLTWTATITVPWLAAAPDGGVLPPAMPVVVSADPTGLPVGAHDAAIILAGPPDCPNCPRIVPVRLRIEPLLHHVYLPVVLKRSH